MDKQLLDKIIEKALRAHFAPGFTLLVMRGGEKLYQASRGHQTYDMSSPNVDFLTIYDIASVTKALVATGALLLIDQGKLRLSDRIDSFFPLLRNTFAGGRTIWHLLTHTSLLQNVRLSSFYDPLTLETIVSAVGVLKRNTPQEMLVEYANVNTFLLGEIVSRVSGSTLDVFLTENLLDPLQMRDTMFNPPKKYWGRIPPTSGEDEESKQRKVHDPSARLLGGVCGHAGLFSTAPDLSNFLEMWINNGVFRGRPILSASIVVEAVKNQTMNYNLKSGLGWHLDNEEYLGRNCPVGTFFHPGFTGTIIAASPTMRITAVFLANYTFLSPTDPSRKKEFFRDIFEAIFKNNKD